MALSAQIAEDVTRTWGLVASSPLEPVGVAFFLKIFEIAPEALQLFSFKDEPNLAESPKLKKHAMSVMNTVGVAVAGLADLASLVPVLQGLGKKHVPYGVLPVHYDVVGQALLATLEAGLGAEWTAQVKAAWIAVYGVISTTMIGDNYPPAPAAAPAKSKNVHLAREEAKAAALAALLKEGEVEGDQWNWGTGRIADEGLDRIHSEANVAVLNNAHGDGGAFVGGEWVDIEDVASQFSIKDGSNSRVGCGACPRSRSRHTAAKPDGSYDVIIIGAGCIGSAIARELSKTNASVLMIEAADDVTQGATKGNSGIIHAGFDDKPGSVRAKYCWAGNQMFPELDKELHFGFQRNGSLVVARCEDDLKTLQELMERGEKNGVKNLRIIEQEELRQLEPHVDREAIAALLSPDAGTITPYEYTIALAENACDNGVEVRTRREVVSISGSNKEQGGFTLTVKHWEPPGIVDAAIGDAVAAMNLDGGAAGAGAGASAEPWGYSPSPGTRFTGVATTETYRASFVVNAAGTASDKVAAMVGDNKWHVKPRMGEYILLNKNQGHQAKHVLFPCPHPVYGKGVLVQSTLWGNLILGPTARDTMRKNEESGEYEIDTDVRDEKQDDIKGYILSKCRNLVPGFDAGEVIHTFAGVRAKNTTGDWIIGPVEGVPGFVNAASIDSPGIAASPAIAVAVVGMLAEAGCAAALTRDPNFNPRRAPLIAPKKGLAGLKFSKKESDYWKETDPTKNVICKCERVTEAEVIDACRRSLPIDSSQAIRKRTRAGMGHCQGDPDNYDCEARVRAIIARETGQPMELVGGRPWPASSLMPKRVVDEDAAAHLRVLSDPSKEYVLHGAA